MVSGAQIISAAEQYAGVPYSQSNPQSPSSGLDCSGLVQLALSNLGISIPRTTSAQLAAAASGQVGTDIGTNLASAEPGDVIHYLGHEEIWLGNGQVFSESTYGTRAAIRGVGGPGPIIGIVRYANGQSTNATLASSVTNGGSTSSGGPLIPVIDPISSFENWAGSVALRVGMIVFGAILIIFGLILAFKDTGVGRTAIKTAKDAAIIGAA